MMRTRIAAPVWAGLMLLPVAMPSQANGTSPAAPPLVQYTVPVGGEPLAVWARRPADPRGVILLIHGRTWAALPDFDLQVPGQSWSVLQKLAARGYAAYAVDLRGYGRSPRDPGGWLTPARAVLDVGAVLAWITAHERPARRPVLLGWSLGSMVSQLLAQKHGDQISALILYGYPFDVGTRMAATPAPAIPPRERTTADDAREDFISPAATSPGVVDAYVAAALKWDPVRTDWRDLDQFNALDPSRVRVPTLLLQGERDPSVSRESLARFFHGLASRDKQWITLTGGDHAALLENTRPTFIDAVVGFLERERAGAQ